MVIILSFTLSSSIWASIDAREKGVISEGRGGVALDEFQSVKILVMGLLFGSMSVVGACSLGEVGDQLISYMDEYSNNGHAEADDKNTGD